MNIRPAEIRVPVSVMYLVSGSVRLKDGFIRCRRKTPGLEASQAANDLSPEQAELKLSFRNALFVLEHFPMPMHELALLKLYVRLAQRVRRMRDVPSTGVKPVLAGMTSLLTPVSPRSRRPRAGVRRLGARPSSTRPDRLLRPNEPPVRTKNHQGIVLSWIAAPD